MFVCEIGAFPSALAGFVPSAGERVGPQFPDARVRLDPQEGESHRILDEFFASVRGALGTPV